MKQWVQDFKQFALRGNVVDMAVGIVIGAAFGKIVSTFVATIISPLIGLLTGGFDFVNLKIVLRHAVMDGEKIVKPELVLGYGELITVILDFIIVAFAIFWVIRIMDKLVKQHKKEETPAPAPEPPTPEDVVLLREIRDLLKTKQ
ncbi:MAG: large-conductance mechanosensitive channel protein MscL [Bacteroidales bacterium]|nr:large-conductance mechanosensitive channel protein MscL [Bacteroidales bacterium]